METLEAPVSDPKQSELRTDLVRDLLSELRRLAEEGSALEMPDLAYALILDAQRERASDVHIEPRRDEYRVRVRIDGCLHDVAVLNVPQARILLNQFKAISDVDPIVRFTPKDTRATVMLPKGKIDLRLALAPCQHGEKLAIR